MALALEKRAAAENECDEVGRHLPASARSESTEAVIEPDLPIIDPHHHLWIMPPPGGAIHVDREHRATTLLDVLLDSRKQGQSLVLENLLSVVCDRPRYALEELLADLSSGHNVRATVFMDSLAMYRVSGPEALRSVGEVEFVNGVAAMAESGIFGEIRACAGIVGRANLHLGEAVEEVLRSQVQAGGGRYRGICHGPNPGSKIDAPSQADFARDKNFRAGFKWLERLGLSYNGAGSNLLEIARAFPGTQIVLSHAGAPIGSINEAGETDERFTSWRNEIVALSKCPNVAVKLGGLEVTLSSFELYGANPPFTSEQLAKAWRPYIETCIESFGADRCMFESEWPVPSRICTYPVLWNAFKRMVAGTSQAEKRALFSGTAAKIYRIQV